MDNSAADQNASRRRHSVDAVLQSDMVHQWYQIIMGFDWKLVQYLIERLEIGPDHLVLDPFCGAGTTLVQCKKQGIRSVGIDANPVCTLASQVKTNWTVQPDRIRGLLQAVVCQFDEEQHSSLNGCQALTYLRESGMIERGWISLHKAKKVLALNASIESIHMSDSERRFFHLGLMSAVVDRIADIKFGPEVYCLQHPKRSHVLPHFVDTIEGMIDDLEAVRKKSRSRISAGVYLGDSRQPAPLTALGNGADFLITSPPYPAEHDYTRSTRLELVMLGHVQATKDLRPLKQRMVRCHTKGIYKDDSDASYARRYTAVQDIARKLNWRARGKTDGFSRLYGRMVQEYFGGMICHLRQVHGMLRPGAKCAYVIRDQQSLSGLYIDTPGIFAKLAATRSQGFALEDIVEWKRAKGSTGKRILTEKIVILRKAA